MKTYLILGGLFAAGLLIGVAACGYIKAKTAATATPAATA